MRREALTPVNLYSHFASEILFIKKALQVRKKTSKLWEEKMIGIGWDMPVGTSVVASQGLHTEQTERSDLVEEMQYAGAPCRLFSR